MCVNREYKKAASRTFAQNVHRVEIGSQRSGIVGQKSVRSKQRCPARVVGGTIAEDLFNRGLCLPPERPRLKRIWSGWLIPS